SRVSKPGFIDLFDNSWHISISKNDPGIRATHLKQSRYHLVGSSLIDAPSRRCAAGKTHKIDILLKQGRPDISGSINLIEDPVRHASFEKSGVEQFAEERHFFRNFENNGISCNKVLSNAPCKIRKWKIPRDDDRCDPCRFMEDLSYLLVVAVGFIGLQAFLPMRQIPVPILKTQIHRRFRSHNRSSHLATSHKGKRVFSILENINQSFQYGYTAFYAKRLPDRLRGSGLCHRRRNFHRSAYSNFPKYLVVTRRIG